MGICDVYLDAAGADALTCSPDGPQEKPPVGYKCKVCESEEVGRRRLKMSCKDASDGLPRNCSTSLWTVRSGRNPRKGMCAGYAMR